MSVQASVREEIRNSSVGDVLRLTTDDGETYKVHLVDSVLYTEPEGYGNGSLTVSGELDTEEHAVPEDFDSCSVDVRASVTGAYTWGDVTIAVWEPIVDDGHVEEDKWRSLGTVTDVEVVERHE